MLREPPLCENRMPGIYDESCLLEFLIREISREDTPAARRKWYWPLTRWRLVKRDRVHGE
jgi:hypothetical protein